MNIESSEIELEYGSYEDPEFTIRVMNSDDISAVVEIDRQASGYRRDQYFQEKMDSSTSEPVINTSLLAEHNGRTVGFLMGQLYFGEFGIPVTRASLDTMGVDRGYLQRGVGHALMDQYRKNMSSLRVEAIDTLVSWDRPELLEFFKRENFRISNMVDLIWDIDKFPFAGQTSHVVVRGAKQEDLPRVGAIDQQIMIMSRPHYFASRLKATARAPHKNVFLVAELDAEVVGYTTGSIFGGEFGVNRPRGVIDSFNVCETARHKSVASALMEDLLARSLQSKVTQLETIVRWNNWELLQFFDYVGFRPSPYINLELRV